MLQKLFDPRDFTGLLSNIRTYVEVGIIGITLNPPCEQSTTVMLCEHVHFSGQLSDVTDVSDITRSNDVTNMRGWSCMNAILNVVMVKMLNELLVFPSLRHSVYYNVHILVERLVIVLIS